MISVLNRFFKVKIYMKNNNIFLKLIIPTLKFIFKNNHRFIIKKKLFKLTEVNKNDVECLFKYI